MQVSAWGWQHGTGLEAIDYMFTDAISLPEARAHLWAETPYHLPSGVHLYRFSEQPEVGPLPALKSGYITLGALTRPDKLSDTTLDLWMRLLRALPESRFILKLSSPVEAYYAPTLTARFADAGINPARLRIEGKSDQWTHLSLLAEIDFQLDSHPICASVSGLESLRMGVPVLTLISERFSSRHMAAYSHLVGCDDWVTETADDFVRVGVEKANDLEGLAALRGDLRGRFDGSLLGDHVGFARCVEGAYRVMWRRWCGNR